MKELGDVYFAWNRYEDAKKIYDEILSIRYPQRVYPSHDPERLSDVGRTVSEGSIVIFDLREFIQDVDFSTIESYSWKQKESVPILEISTKKASKTLKLTSRFLKSPFRTDNSTRTTGFGPTVTLEVWLAVKRSTNPSVEFFMFTGGAKKKISTVTNYDALTRNSTHLTNILLDIRAPDK
jgi:hypothetical protein